MEKAVSPPIEGLLRTVRESEDASAVRTAVIQLGYGSIYDKVEWVEREYREADRFLEMKRGLFFKASYLWRL